jgi:hypothetical protein
VRKIEKPRGISGRRPGDFARMRRFGPEAKLFSRVLSNTSRALTSPPAHGDVSLSRSDSAPSNAGCPVIDPGQIWPVWASSRWRRSTRTSNFFHFFPPLSESQCLAPARKLDCRTAQGPYRFHRLEETLGCDSLRGPARLRFRAESSPALRADLVYLAYALEIQGFCDVAPRKPCPEILSSSIVTSVKPASPS